MASDRTFTGWVSDSPQTAVGNMVWKDFLVKEWEEDDIDIRVTHSAICATDHHTLSSEMGPVNYPIVVGHEIVGVAIRIGTSYTGDIQLGDIVGIGGVADSCVGRDGPCHFCENDLDQYCGQLVPSFSGRFRNGDKSMGGHALFHRGKSYYAHKIPQNLRPEYAAPMLCAGVTAFAPLEDLGVAGKSVGVVGVGGVGHFAVLFAKALGAKEVVGISRSDDKRDQVMELGCNDYIATEDDPNWASNHASRFDVILSTVDSGKVPFDGYINLLKFGGTLVQVGGCEPVNFNPISLIIGRKKIMGSMIGSRSEIKRMLRLAADKQIKPWVETRPMSEANQAMVDMREGKARFRYVLVNE